MGEACVNNGVVWKNSFQEAQKQNKHLIYFDISVKNIEGPDEKHLQQMDFKLEDTEGNTYSVEQTKDYIRGSIHRNKQGRGGISFFVYEGNIPKRLIYNTDYLSLRSGEGVFAVGEVDKYFK